MAIMPMTAPSIREIFDSALDIGAADERRTYLDEACSGAPQVRRQVEALLEAHAAAGSFLETPPAAVQAGLTAAIEQSIAEGPGSQIGPYKLLEQLGEGGMGVVYLAEQHQPVERRVALKIIKPGMDTRQVIARFEAERQALSLMEHPHIAKVLDAGTTESGRPYFVMELVSGVPITKYCDERRLTLRQRLELFIPVCQAIQHAHQKGIIHRDLKPSNVLIAEYDGQAVAKVIDFGVAKATGPQVTEGTRYTELGQIVGTLEYMSPEQASLNQLDIDTRSDIYSLGVLLYELLTGSTPFDQRRRRPAAFDELLRIIREVDPPRPSSRLSACDALPSIAASRGAEPARLKRLVRGELDWIVMKALDKDRNRRYETANGLALDLQRYLANEPVLACPPSQAYLLRKFVQRNKGPVAATLLVMLALVGGVIGTTWGMFHARVAKAAAVEETKQKVTALQQAEKTLWLSLYERARAGRFSRHMGQRLESLEALAKAARLRPDERLRDEAIAALALPDIRRTSGWPSSPPTQQAVAYGSNYRLYARMDEPEVISIRAIPGDREVQRIASGPILGTYLHFSPDDRFLVGLQNGYRLRVWNVADGQSALPGELPLCRAHAFSSDGRQLAVSQFDQVSCIDLATKQEAHRWKTPAPIHSLAFDPDNRRIAVGFLSSNVASVYDAASGELLADLPVGTISTQVVTWHPQGDVLAVASSDPRIQLWHVASQRKVSTLTGHVQNVPDVTFHPDGSLVASHGWDGMLYLWDPATGRQLMGLTFVGSPRFSTDGQWVGTAWGASGVELLEATSCREYRTLLSSAGIGAGGYNHGDISPDGRYLAVAMDAGCRLWDLESGRELCALPKGTNYVSFDKQEPAPGSPTAPGAPNWCLLTCGSAGLLRWPTTTDEQDSQHLRLGPPQRMSSLPRAWFTRGTSGRTLGVATEEGGANQLLDLETGDVQREFGVHLLGEVRALSPDGRWAASSGWHSDRVRLFNAQTGELIHEWILGKRTYVFFSPDSRSLVISRDSEISFWDVDTLQRTLELRRDIAQFPSHVAFSSDGQLMAMEMSPAVVHLKEVATGKTIARLEDPQGDRAAWLGFTPDGTKLVVTAGYASAVHVWDLRAIRTRLKEMNLDWDWPEFQSAPPGASTVQRLTIEVLLAEPTRPP
jgi:serine/threonine protein kinase/WD40 repeat protein